MIGKRKFILGIISIIGLLIYLFIEHPENPELLRILIWGIVSIIGIVSAGITVEHFKK